MAGPTTAETEKQRRIQKQVDRAEKAKPAKEPVKPMQAEPMSYIEPEAWVMAAMI